jgi:hypothetical protein
LAISETAEIIRLPWITVIGQFDYRYQIRDGILQVGQLAEVLKATLLNQTKVGEVH